MEMVFNRKYLIVIQPIKGYEFKELKKKFIIKNLFY